MKSNCYKTHSGKLCYFDTCLNVQETIVFLHGFTGSSRDFISIPDIINYRCLIPDLPGHGLTDLEDEMSFTAIRQVALLEQWLNFLGQSKFHLFGYSMGGRLALQFAVKNPHRLQSLILVSTGAGISDESARLARARADKQLAQKILESEPIDFLNTWLSQPLFKEIAEKGKDFVAGEVLRRLPLQIPGLAYSLKHFGTGTMPSVWHQLVNVAIPTLVIAGSKDRKYLELSYKLASLMPKAILKILPTGHAPLIESPDLLWEEVGEFLNLIEGQLL